MEAVWLQAYAKSAVRKYTVPRIIFFIPLDLINKEKGRSFSLMALKLFL